MHGLDFGAETAQDFDRRVDGRRDIRVRGVAIPILGDADPQSAHPAVQPGRIVRHRDVLAAGVMRVVAGDDLEEQRDVLGAAGQGPQWSIENVFGKTPRRLTLP